MKHLIIGMGSMGRRHYANLRSLQPNDTIKTMDTVAPADYQTLNADAVRDSVVYICTPTRSHLNVYYTCLTLGARAIFCEKPVMESGNRELIVKPNIPFAVGYQYRFHPKFQAIKHSLQWEIPTAFHVYASEDLSARYTDGALELLLAHPIDTAHWLFGEMAMAKTVSDPVIGAWFGGMSKSGVEISMTANYMSLNRISLAIVNYAERQEIHDIYPCDSMYLDQLCAFLTYVETGFESHLCTFDQAIRTQRALG